jgi:dihydroorotate dehydrogenase (NAD+) catalytic subunit
MPAAGTFGYGPECHHLIEYGEAFNPQDPDHNPSLGAIVTNPVSFNPRQAAHGPRLAVHGSHILVHTGLPNPGLQKVIREYARFWGRQPLPVIVHLIATTPRDVARACDRLSTVPNVMGVELGLDEGTSVEETLALLDAAQTGGTLPVISRVPFDGVATLTPALAEAGSDALTLTAPPRGLLRTEQGWAKGRLYGPATLPLLLHHLAYWAQALSVPIIACGGIYTPEDAQACLALGATAVQVDAAIWRDPQILSACSHPPPVSGKLIEKEGDTSH